MLETKRPRRVTPKRAKAAGQRTSTASSDPALVKLPEAATILGVSINTVENWTAKGYLTTTGKPKRWNRKDLEAIRESMDVDRPDVPDDGPLVGIRTIAEVLGTTSNQVYMWHQRRNTTAFPECRAMTLIPAYPGDRRKSPQFDLNEVVDWWVAYDPNRRRGQHWKQKRDAEG